MTQQFTLRQKIRYHFDNFMAKGTRSQLIGLGMITLIMVFIFTILFFVFELEPDGPRTMPPIIYNTLMSVMRARPPSWMPDHVGFMLVKFLVLLTSMFVVSMLIGILTSGFRSMVKDLARGRSFVPVKDHTLILGWSSVLMGIVSELIVANESRAEGNIIILADRDKLKMDRDINKKVKAFHNTAVVTRTGNPLSAFDLELVNIDGARSIIILPPDDDDDPDIQIIKTLMAIVGRPGRRSEPYNIVTSIRDKKNLRTAALACRGEEELIASTDVISKITAQACRQSGLPVVYSEIMSFRDNEIYTIAEPQLEGKTFGELLFCYNTSCVMGIETATKELLFNTDFDYVLKPGDKLILLAEDDSLIVVKPESPSIDEDLIIAKKTMTPAVEKTMILGWNAGTATILKELDKYVRKGSEVFVLVPSADDIPYVEEVSRQMEFQTLNYRVGDATAHDELASLHLPSYDHIILLRYSDLMPGKSDAKVMITLLYVRDFLQQAGAEAAVVTELVLEQNRHISQTDRADDFVVGNHLISLLYSQISENGERNSIFKNLLGEKGSEIYLKPVSDYVKTNQPVDFYTVLEAAKRKNEVALGYRQLKYAADKKRNFGVKLNPTKTEKVTYAANDRIIVLAEHYFT